MSHEEAPLPPAPSEAGPELSESGSNDAIETGGASEATPEDGEHNPEDGEQAPTEAEGAEEAGESTASDATDGTQPKKKRRRRKRRPSTEPGAAETPSRHPPRASDRVPFRVGEEVYGKITAVLDEAIMIDLSGKALAIFDRGEMEHDDLVPSVGDRFVAHVHNDGVRGGLVVLTRKPLREEETKPRIEKALADGSLVRGLVTGTIKGGIEVDLDGLRAFAPASGIDLHPANANFAGLVGQRIDFKVIQYEKNGRDVVVTRRPMLEAEAHERRKQALTLLSENQVMEGVVRTVVEWGVFVAMPAAENLEGLIHVTEASHDPRAYLLDLFKPGDKIQVQIIKIDEKGKIWLSRKALVEDPWAAARQKYAAGTRHTGTVRHLEDFGAFIEMEPGVDGLLHVADLSFERIEHPKEKLEEGATIEVVVAHVDPRTRKLTLHPALTGDKEKEEPQRVVRGASIRVEVVKIEAQGLLVRVQGVTGRLARGFIPAGQTGTPRGTELRKAFRLGAVVSAKVLDVDPKRGEPRLSIKGLAEDEERRATNEYRSKLHAQGGFGTLGDLFRSKLGQVSGGATPPPPADLNEPEPAEPAQTVAELPLDKTE